MTGHKRDQSDLSIVEHDLDALTRNARTLGEGSTDSASSAGSKSPFDIREHYNSYIQDPASAQPSSATAQQFPEPEALAHVPRCLAPSHISYEPNTYTASPHSLSRGESSRNSAPSYRSDELPVGAEAGNYAQWFQSVNPRPLAQPLPSYRSVPPQLDMTHPLESPPDPSSPVGDWHGVAGAYAFGVGYEMAEQDEELAVTTSKRLEKLEKRFQEDAAGVQRPNLATSMKHFEAERKRRKAERQRAAGADTSGRLLGDGRKKRAALRWAQTVGTLIVGFGSLGASWLTEPEKDPPPSGSAALYALYVLPFLSLALTIYVTLIRPCLYRRRRKDRSRPGRHDQTAMQWLTAPVGMGNGKNKKGSAPSHNVQVLVIDPTKYLQESRDRRGDLHRQQDRAARRVRQRQRDDADDELLSAGSDSGEDEVFEPSELGRDSADVGQLEEDWRAARSWTARLAWIDLAATTVWSVIAIYAIGWGKRCPSGTGGGWCDLYNTALAFSVLIAMCFAASAILGVLLYRASKLSPRERAALKGRSNAI